MELEIVDGYLVGADSHNGPIYGMEIPNFGGELTTSFVDEFIVDFIPTCCSRETRSRKLGEWMEGDSVNEQAKGCQEAADDCEQSCGREIAEVMGEEYHDHSTGWLREGVLSAQLKMEITLLLSYLSHWKLCEVRTCRVALGPFVPRIELPIGADYADLTLQRRAPYLSCVLHISARSLWTSESFESVKTGSRL